MESSENKYNNSNENKIISMKKIIRIDNLELISSILELSDSRIALGGVFKTIKIYSVNFKYKYWKREIEQENAHDHTL